MLLMILGLNTVAIVIISVLIFRQSKKVKSILNNRYPPKFVYYDEISKVYREINSLSEEIRKMRLDKTSEMSGGLMSEKLYRNSYIVTFPGNIHISDDYLNDVAELALRTIVSNLPEGKQSRRVIADIVSRIKEIMDSKKIEL